MSASAEQGGGILYLLKNIKVPLLSGAGGLFVYPVKEVTMKKNIQIILSLFLISALALSVACTGTSPPPVKEPGSPPTPPTQEKSPQPIKPETEETTSFPITVTDDLGRKVTINKLPQRIVSLAPSNTEILFALGLDDKIIGVTDYCDYPEAAKSKPRVAGYSTPNLEKLVSLQPDLVLAESIHEKTVLPALEKLGLTIFLSWARSIDTIMNDITSIGQMNGKSKTATQLVNKLTSRIKAVSTKTQILSPEKRPRVLYVVWHQPIRTMGSETFIDDLIKTAGGINIFSKDFDKSRVVSLESVVAKNPQVIIVTGMATSGDLIYNAIKTEERLKSVDAMVNNRIYRISDANLIERPGPRIVDGLDELAKLIHPEIFGTPTK
jgi:iron complex transport system substrate-binding protein